MEKTGMEQESFSMLDNVPMGICVIRSDYTVMFWNTCLEDWTGLSKTGMLGRCLYESFPVLKEAGYKSRIEMIFSGGAPAVFSSQLHGTILPSKRPNGRPRIFHTLVTAIPSAGGDGYNALFAIEDVSELTERINGYRLMHERAMCEIEQRKKTEAEKEILINDLKKALAEVRTLSGMLPICASCKKIRDDSGYWQQVELYIKDHSGVDFTHSICPDCAAKYFPSLAHDVNKDE